MWLTSSEVMLFDPLGFPSSTRRGAPQLRYNELLRPPVPTGDTTHGTGGESRLAGMTVRLETPAPPVFGKEIDRRNVLKLRVSRPSP
jgi:hypothetical protein